MSKSSSASIIFEHFSLILIYSFFFQAEDGIRDRNVTGVQTCALPIMVNVRKSQRTVGFCLITSATTFCDWIPCFIALLQWHIGHRRDLQNQTRYNVLPPVSSLPLYSSTSAPSFTLSAFLTSRICKCSR